MEQAQQLQLMQQAQPVQQVQQVQPVQQPPPQPAVNVNIMLQTMQLIRELTEARANGMISEEVYQRAWANAQAGLTGEAPEA